METGIKHISFPFNKIQFLLQMNFFYKNVFKRPQTILMSQGFFVKSAKEDSLSKVLQMGQPERPF